MINNINAQQAFEEFEKKTTFLDIRETYEFQQIRIPGAKLIPMSELGARLEEISKDEKMVVYCASGARSMGLLSQLSQMGYSNLYNLDGGISSWYSAGYETEQG